MLLTTVYGIIYKRHYNVVPQSHLLIKRRQGLSAHLVAGTEEPFTVQSHSSPVLIPKSMACVGVTSHALDWTLHTVM